MSTVLTDIHFDELRVHALRDVSKLEPGAEILFCHVPVFGEPDMFNGKEYAEASRVTVTEVASKTFAELHPKLRDPIETEPGLVIIYDDGVRTSYRYASDAGVTPYSGATIYNQTNFTVLVSDLTAKGLNPLLTVSPSFELELESYNAKIDPSFDTLLDDLAFDEFD